MPSKKPVATPCYNPQECSLQSEPLCETQIQ
jgi:hypothetical protein